MTFRLLTAACVMAVTCCGVVDAQLPDDNPVYNSYLTFDPPTIDGVISPGEWDDAGDPYVMTWGPGGSAIPADPFGGEADLSFQWRTMWTPFWDVYFLVEVTDDIAMDDAHNPSDRPWQRDQVEIWIDGDELAGGEIRWWQGDDIDPVDTYGKFGVARTNEWEGSTGQMSDSEDDVAQGLATLTAKATETGENGNYFVEYWISLKPAFESGLFDDTLAGDSGTLVPNDPSDPDIGTAIKIEVQVVDNDNFETADNNNSNNWGLPRTGEINWWDSNSYANLLFWPEFTGTGPGPDCDFDANGTCDLDDIDALTVEASTGNSTNPNFDLDDDGQVGDSDIEAWLMSAGLENGFDAFLYGDANLDGAVEAGDLNIVAINWNDPNVNEWSRGNFGGSGVGADDLNRLAINWQQSSAAPAASSAAVPEPAGLMLVGIGLSVLGLLRRSRCG